MNALKEPPSGAPNAAAKNLDTWSSGPLARPSAPRRSRSRTAHQRQPGSSNATSSAVSPSNSDRSKLSLSLSGSNPWAALLKPGNSKIRHSWTCRRMCSGCQSTQQSQSEYFDASAIQWRIRDCNVWR